MVIVSGVIRRGGDLLLVQEQAPVDPVPFWALPGGRAEPGEVFHETLIREMREETGLQVLKIGRLLYATQHQSASGFAPSDALNPSAVTQSTAVIFDVTEWQGELHPNDPDAYIIEARFLPLLEATKALEAAPFRVMSEPLLAYLRGEVQPGAVWCYRRQLDGTDQLVTRPE